MELQKSEKYGVSTDDLWSNWIGILLYKNVCLSNISDYLQVELFMDSESFQLMGEHA